jgi:myo-inositol-1(or 4)-monophosphatase
MDSKIDWLSLLIECEKKVKIHIRDVNKLESTQIDLGVGAGGDPIKMVDVVAEKAITEVMVQQGISFTLISEETGIKKFRETPDECYITVDPIDGTTNFVRGLPFYCSSIAVSRQPFLSHVFAAIVTDLHHDFSYIAVEGKGAYRDGKKLFPSTIASLEEAMIGLDLNTHTVNDIAPHLTDLIRETKHIRHFGANALELCYVANGLTDAFVDIRGRLRTTDVAGAFFILKEAGGIVTTPEGQPLDAKLSPTQRIKFVASGNKEIHKEILDLLKQSKEKQC